jgi:O-succinylbenzoate synthase
VLRAAAGRHAEPSSRAGWPWDPGDRRPRAPGDGAVTAGYRRIKIKIKPGWDVAAVAAARDALSGSAVPLTVDANGAYRWPEDTPALQALDAYGLLYIEQPLAPEELVGHARLGGLLRTPLCLDETLRSADIGRQVLELDGPRIWNLKVHRVGGLTEACRIQRLAAGAGSRCGRDDASPGSAAGRDRDGSHAGVRVSVGCGPSVRWFGPDVDVIALG